jgi:hypothetical protein
MDKLPPGMKLPAGVSARDVERFVAEHEAQQKNAKSLGLPGADGNGLDVRSIAEDFNQFTKVFREDYSSLPSYMKTCAFGPTFFDGVKWGAALTFLPTVFLCRRSYRRARLAARDKSKWLFETDPWAAIFCVACSITATMKASKFVLSRGRVREFEFEEEYAIATATDEELEVMATMKVLRDAAERGEDLFADDEMDEEMERAQALRRRRLGGRDIGNKQTLSAQLPTWWDGFAVGAYGSLADAHTPLNPPTAYLGMRAGRTTFW